MAELVQASPDSPGQHIIDRSLNRFLDSYYHIKGRHEAHALSVGLLALTKSGGCHHPWETGRAVPTNGSSGFFAVNSRIGPVDFPVQYRICTTFARANVH